MKVVALSFLLLAIVIYSLGWGSKKNSFTSWNIEEFQWVKNMGETTSKIHKEFCNPCFWLHYYFYPAYGEASNVPLPKATVALIHGLGGQNEGYHALCTKLSQIGVDVCVVLCGILCNIQGLFNGLQWMGPFRRGQGISIVFELIRTSENGISDVISDYNTFLNFIEDKQTRMNRFYRRGKDFIWRSNFNYKENSNYNRIVCIGKSLGGLAVLHSTLFHQKCEAGVVLLAPAIMFHTERLSEIHKFLLPPISNLFPKLPIRWDKDGEVALRLGSENSVYQYMVNDMDKLQSLFEKTGSLPPSFILQGDSDRVTNKEALKGLISKVVEGSNQVAYQELAGLGHDLEIQDIVHQTILSWFNNNILIKR